MSFVFSANNEKPLWPVTVTFANFESNWTASENDRPNQSSNLKEISGNKMIFGNNMYPTKKVHGFFTMESVSKYIVT